MARARTYLDCNATTPVRPEALDAFARVARIGANASSVHAEGRLVRAAIEAARAQVAALVGAHSPESVTFMSGGTEAAALALAPMSGREGRRIERLLVSAGEHAAVLKGHRFPPDAVERVGLTPQGTIDLAALKKAVTDRPPAVLALQAANNETGVVQPLAEAAALVRAAGGLLVCDAVQAPGRMPCAGLAADLVLVSGHKLGGLPGAGACVVLNADVVPVPLSRGGGQERGLRGGTENAPALAAFGAVADLASGAPDAPRMAGLRARFERELKALAPDVVIFGETVARLPNTSAFAVPGVAAERLMMALDLDGVAVSSGSACSSGVVGRSHVLEAMGVEPDVSRGMIRVSFGWSSTHDDVSAAVTSLTAILVRMRRPAPAAA